MKMSLFVKLQEIIPANQDAKKFEFSLDILISNIKIFTKKKPNRGRIIIILIFAIACINTLGLCKYQSVCFIMEILYNNK